jgi:hypothetical protein
MPKQKSQRKPLEEAKSDDASMFDLAVDLAQKSYLEVGRGAAIINTIAISEDGSHPYSYVPQETIENFEKLDSDLAGEAVSLVREYDPNKEAVAVLVKPEEWVSYVIGTRD